MEPSLRPEVKQLMRASEKLLAHAVHDAPFTYVECEIVAYYARELEKSFLPYDQKNVHPLAELVSRLSPIK